MPIMKTEDAQLAICAHRHLDADPFVRTNMRGATPDNGMDNLNDQFHAGRRKMRDAFVEVCMIAARAGADASEIFSAQYDFFDGHVEIKDAFGTVAFLVEFKPQLARSDAGKTESPS
jgi:hypothetical protein